ncbi:unnamed protein product [Linum trigynum]|uniref:Uncharacterized protein n=1 Tax=Linum trigynum TaxID=586398 RepID=A0AAV2E133_9ROSI
MATLSEPPTEGGSNIADLLSGQRRPPTDSSSPNPKGDREAQQTKKRAKPTVAVDISVENPNDINMEPAANVLTPPATQSPKVSAWSHGMGATRRLFGDFAKTDEWNVADSDSEDVAATMREDGREAEPEEEDDPLCPPIQFSDAEERQFCRPLRSALVVKVLGRSTSYTTISKRLNSICAKAGSIQVT